MTGQEFPRETAQEIEAEAARWIWRLDGAEPSSALHAELEAWLIADPRRKGAWMRAEAAWAMLDRGSQLAEITPTPSPASGRQGVGRRMLFAGGGSLLAAGVAGALWMRGREHFSTVLGEIRRVPLSDGSVAAINTESAIEVAMTSHERRVRLDRGEAWFDVAKNPDRPFVVDAGSVRVRAVGTAFSVRRIGADTQVLVTEGVVEALVDGRSIGRLAAGSRAMIARDDRVLAPEQVAAADRLLAWRGGQIDLAGQTLEVAAAEFNRYNARKIVIGNPAMAGQRLYGVFRVDDPESFARSLTISLGASVALNTHQIRVD